MLNREYVLLLLSLIPLFSTAQTDEPAQRDALLSLFESTSGSDWTVFQEQPSLIRWGESGTSYCK